MAQNKTQPTRRKVSEFIAGIDNLLDTYPDKNPGAGDLGQLYSEASPFGFNGMSWYLRARLTF